MKPVAHAFKTHDGFVLYACADPTIDDYLGWIGKRGMRLARGGKTPYRIVWPEDREADEEIAAAMRST